MSMNTAMDNAEIYRLLHQQLFEDDFPIPYHIHPVLPPLPIFIVHSISDPQVRRIYTLTSIGEEETFMSTPLQEYQPSP